MSVALERLVDPATRGDRESPLRWTSKSTQALADELHAQGHSVASRTVAKLLHVSGYSLQATRKTREGRDHPRRLCRRGVPAGARLTDLFRFSALIRM